MKSLVWPALSLLLVPSIFAQPKGYLYDEAKVPHYILPDLLTTQKGATVKTVKDWEIRRRSEVLALFEEHMYGRSPGRPAKLSFHVLEEAEQVLGGLADRRQVEVRFAGKAEGPRMTVLIYRPTKARKAVPAFLTLNFRGNHLSLIHI